MITKFASFDMQIFLYGGYSKELSSDKNSSEKGTVHSDMWSLDPRTWEWNKVLTLPKFLYLTIQTRLVLVPRKCTITNYF